MTKRLGAGLLLIMVMVGCAGMKPSDFENAEPKLSIEEYFLGQTLATGIFEDRFGRLRRQFVVDITGTTDSDVLTLDERFRYSDGETDRRGWSIRRTGPHNYEGRANDVIGVAHGEAYGNALHWRYDVDLKVGGTTLRVHFDDWMFLQPSGVLINRARVSKFGIEIGQVTLFFSKPADVAAYPGTPLTLARRGGEPILSASQ
jgi:Protein of unknown function (DUF3833)